MLKTKPVIFLSRKCPMCKLLYVVFSDNVKAGEIQDELSRISIGIHIIMEHRLGKTDVCE